MTRSRKGSLLAGARPRLARPHTVVATTKRVRVGILPSQRQQLACFRGSRLGHGLVPAGQTPYLLYDTHYRICSHHEGMSAASAGCQHRKPWLVCLVDGLYYRLVSQYVLRPGAGVHERAVLHAMASLWGY